MAKPPQKIEKPTINPVEFLQQYMKGKDDMIIQLTNVRLSFADLFKPVAFQGGDGEKKFRATLLIPKNSPQVKTINHAINEVAAAAWKDKAKSALSGISSNPQKYCFTDGDTKSYDGYAGQMALTATNKKRPTVVDRNKAALVEEDGKPYSGCYVNASVEIWTQDNQYGKAIRASLRGVQFLRDGDAFTAGSVASEDEFEDLGEGAGDDEDLA